MPKQNCWEAKRCCRETGGAATFRSGPCPASTESRVDGMNGGRNAGRVCWMIAGTLCGGKVQGTFAAKHLNCLECDFYLRVTREEGPAFCRASEILGKLGPASGQQRPAPDKTPPR